MILKSTFWYLRCKNCNFRDYILIANFLGMVFLPLTLLAILNFKLFIAIKVRFTVLLNPIIYTNGFSPIDHCLLQDTKLSPLILHFCQQSGVRCTVQLTSLFFVNIVLKESGLRNQKTTVRQKRDREIASLLILVMAAILLIDFGNDGYSITFFFVIHLHHKNIVHFGNGGFCHGYFITLFLLFIGIS